MKYFYNCTEKFTQNYKCQIIFFYCLQFEPKSRPSFSEIVRKLEGMLRGKSGPAGPEYAEERAARAAAAADGIHAQANHAKGQAKGAKGLSDACLAGLAASSLAARSVEVIPSTPDDAGHGKSVNRHKKCEYLANISACKRTLLMQIVFKFYVRH